MITKSSTVCGYSHNKPEMFVSGLVGPPDAEIRLEACSVYTFIMCHVELKIKLLFTANAELTTNYIVT